MATTLCIAICVSRHNPSPSRSFLRSFPSIPFPITDLFRAHFLLFPASRETNESSSASATISDDKEETKKPTKIGYTSYRRPEKALKIKTRSVSVPFFLIDDLSKDFLSDFCSLFLFPRLSFWPSGLTTRSPKPPSPRSKRRKRAFQTLSKDVPRLVSPSSQIPPLFPALVRCLMMFDDV